MRAKSLFVDAYCEQPFFRHVYPYIFRGDRSGLAAMLREQYPAERLIGLLEHPDEATVKVALVCIGLTGGMEHSPAVARFLLESDVFVVRLAEYALKNMWRRDGGALQESMLRRAEQHLDAGESDHALLLLNRMLVETPDFAEAAYQRAVTHYCRSSFSAALRDAQRAIRRNGLHCWAYQLAAQCQLALGEYESAVQSYQDALRIHPSLEGAHGALAALRAHFSAY